MSFIEKVDPVVLNIKITSKGRELLAQGKLDFKYFALGDSEIDYNLTNEIIADVPDYSATNSLIFRPVDKNPKIISFVTKTISGETDYMFNEIENMPISPYVVQNPVQSIGFYNNDCSEFKTNANFIKQPDVMVNVGNVSGGKTLSLYKAPTYGISVEEPSVGDYLLIKWSYLFSTTGHTITKTQPTPYLMYKIENIISGNLSSNNLVVSVDRELPNFSAFTISNIFAGALVYYDYLQFTGDTIFNMSSTEYLDESVITFLENSQCPTVIFPYWNLSIIHTEEIAGVDIANIKYTKFKNVNMGGFVSYIQNQAPIYKKLGVIHYTNQSPANVYAEGFYNNTASIEIPTIMWHKSSNTEMGAKFIASGSSKMLTGETKSLNVTYYDLCDLTGFVVGKVFPDLKIFVVEDQELLFALSYKSNRSWTLPNYYIDY